MKSLVFALILFLTVLALVVTDFFILKELLDYTESELEKIPVTLNELENIEKKEKIRIAEALKNIEKRWQKKETFLGLSLKHTVSREFTGYIIPAISYFESEEYPEFLASLLSAKDTAKHIRYDEDLKIGNLF